MGRGCVCMGDSHYQICCLRRHTSTKFILKTCGGAQCSLFGHDDRHQIIDHNIYFPTMVLSYKSKRVRSVIMFPNASWKDCHLYILSKRAPVVGGSQRSSGTLIMCFAEVSLYQALQVSSSLRPTQHRSHCIPVYQVLIQFLSRLLFAAQIL